MPTVRSSEVAGTVTTRASERALRALARAYGVQARYRDVDRVDRTVSTDTLCAVLQVLDAELHSARDAPDALRAYNAARAVDVVEPVVVQWGEQPLEFDARLPIGTDNDHVTITVERDDGDGENDHDGDVPTPAFEVRDGTATDSRRVVLAQPLPFGVYRLHIEGGGRHGDASVLAAPARLAPSPRRWGVFAPAYALHERDRASTGTVESLDRFARWAGDQGASIVGTLPLLATFFGAGNEPCDPSPYAPVSRRHWNEVYLDLSAVPEVEASEVPAEPSPGEFVNLPALAARKRVPLEAAAARLGAHPARAQEFARFCRARPDVVAYASFRAAVELGGTSAPARVPHEHPLARYHAYVQWLIEGQLEQLAARLRARDQELYLDLPIGAHPSGFDVASSPSLFATGAAVGAPPDTFFRAGQNWGFPPFHPGASRRSGHRYVRECIAAHFRVARWLRVDHILGFHRVWWVPDGADAADGAYVRYPAEELYAVLTLAAYRAGGHVVGENLGTVPPETNRALRRHGILGMHVVPFEADADRDPPLMPPAPSTLACLDTHDTATFAVYWRSLTEPERNAFIAALQRAGYLEGSDEATVGAVLSALLEYLGASRAEIVLANIEDLWLETEPQNVPGSTSAERPNFRRRMARSIDDLEHLATSAPERMMLARLDRSRGARGGRA
jgi:4-alpha-glucanotransferase